MDVDHWTNRPSGFAAAASSGNWNVDRRYSRIQARTVHCVCAPRAICSSVTLVIILPLARWAGLQYTSSKFVSLRRRSGGCICCTGCNEH